MTVVMIIKVSYKLTQNKHYNCFQLLHDTVPIFSVLILMSCIINVPFSGARLLVLLPRYSGMSSPVEGGSVARCAISQKKPISVDAGVHII